MNFQVRGEDSLEINEFFVKKKKERVERQYAEGALLFYIPDRVAPRHCNFRHLFESQVDEFRLFKES